MEGGKKTCKPLPSPRSRGEGQGEGRRHNSAAGAKAPPKPLILAFSPFEGEWGEGTARCPGIATSARDAIQPDSILAWQVAEKLSIGGPSFETLAFARSSG